MKSSKITKKRMMETKVISLQDNSSNPMRMVLDKGYVRLIDFMGTDLSAVNAARASFAKESLDFNDRDARLLEYLARENHVSPFRHAFVSFEIKAPLMVARQHWKHVVGSDHTMDGWNEASRRYITSDEEFYIPKSNQWRSAPENKKQGSGDTVPLELGSLAMQMLMEDVERQHAHYTWALEQGICAEQARLYLLAYGLYINYRWSTSLQSVVHFLRLRMDHDAQKEIQDYAHAVYSLTQPIFPVTFLAFGL